ncbi:aminoglycoside phosphotransferase family protein [Rossellomorea marisflavi]|uniref:aminoglycoside phosphotransferase family protein n=1 Tax=Rossellomorea marisflavi TaxID=189381 RepID=UPI001EE19D0B|nr:aminoglycoside phosphotransferase family protein [Rossellomorea marisflavi]UKS63925.1 aminoglycoside phosphotransferase family protein [Rossellomorea marisflavi]
MIPKEFAERMVTMHGERGPEWIHRTEELLASIKEERNLTYGEPFDLSYHFVVPASDGNHDYVLKTGFPGQEFTHEYLALKAFEGPGVVKLIEGKPEEGWMLLNLVKPGTPLYTIKEEADVLGIWSECACALWRQLPDDDADFPTVSDWSRGLSRLRERYSGGTGPIPEYLLEKAETLFPELLSTAGPLYLLHGDLHHGNILHSDKDGWTVIDPKGLIGEREYDCIQFMLNHWQDHPEPLSLLALRAGTLASSLSLSYGRLIRYGLCHAILSASWCTEDGVGDPSNGIELAKLFDTLIQDEH